MNVMVLSLRVPMASRGPAAVLELSLMPEATCRIKLGSLEDMSGVNKELLPNTVRQVTWVHCGGSQL